MCCIEVIFVKYMGSKSRITKYIVPIIQKCIDDNCLTTYVEPFVGGANVIDKVQCQTRIGYDKNKYLIALFLHLQNGGNLLPEVPRTLYAEVRANYKTGKYEDWYVGNIGFLASYNGRWFDGGYAQAGYEKTKTGQRFRNYYEESKNNILQQKPHIKDIVFEVKNFFDFCPNNNIMIYCDPPYNNTKSYAVDNCFNYEDFWNTIRKYSENNFVLVSEMTAPDDFICTWEKSVSRSVRATDKNRAIEKLFTYKNGKYFQYIKTSLTQEK